MTNAKMDLTVPQKPEKVNMAVMFIYYSLGLDVLRIFTLVAFGIITTQTPVSVGDLIVNMVVTFPITIILAILISRGKNWARIIFLILFSLGMIFVIPGLVGQFRYHFLMGLFGVLLNGMQLIAVILLFQSESNVWFKDMKEYGKRKRSADFEK
jgi:hypothetical protein